MIDELLEWLKIPILLFLAFGILRIMMWGWIKLEALFHVPGW